MRAIVLAGGEGTRLRPLTRRTPKPLVPLLDRPLVERLLLHLRAHGFRHVTLALTRTAFPGAVEAAFGDGSRLDITIEYAYEDQPLGSGGAIAAIAAGWDETFLVCNGDIVTDLDLGAMLEAHRARGAELSISLYEVEDPSPFGVADVDGDGRIRRFVEKPPREEAPSRMVNSGMWLFEPALLASMDAATFNRVEDRLFPDLCAAGRPVYGFPHGPYWADVGNPAALLRVNLDLVAALPGGVLVAEDATVAPGARVVAPAVIGAGCTLEEGATVEGSVLWDGVHIGADATVRSSTIASGARIGAGAMLHDAVVAHEASVAPDARLEGVAVEPAPTGASS
ncbi:MAG: NDP-sugar synthase [Dehalococcoidia bacterium]